MRQRIGVGDFQTTPKMRELVNQVLDSGRLSYGPFSRKLERRFAEMHGCKYAVLSNSGTSSLQVALQTLKELHGWRDGDEVIVPAVTFVATVNVVLHNRLKPVLVDVEPDFYGIDVTKISQAFTHNTVAAIPVHLFGMPCDMDGVVRRIPLKNVKIIEDSCESVLAVHRHRHVGAWGDIACFSSYAAHILVTGVGGIATTNNPDYAAKMRSLVNHGRDGIYISIDDDDEFDKEVVSRRFNFESIGHSFRITELEAALAVAQLDDLPANIAQRQANAAYLSDGLRQFEDRLQLPAIRPHTSHSFMMYPIVLREGDKWDLCHFLEERGIETREMLRLTDQPCYKGLWNPDDYPVAKWLNEQGYYVGCHLGLTRDDLDCIIEAHGEYFSGRK
jgi:perosamine synthetase